MRRKIALYVSLFQLFYYNYTIFYCEPEPKLYKPVLKYFLLERTQTGAFQFIWTLTGTEPKFETAVEPKPNLNRKNYTVRHPDLNYALRMRDCTGLLA